MPTVSLVTSTRSLVSPLAPTAIYLGLARGRSSDAAVPYRSQAVPYSDVVSIRGLDHGQTTMAGPFGKIDQRALTLALTALVLRKMER